MGESDFVIEVLAEANEKLNRQYELKSQGYDIGKVADRVSGIYQLDPKYIFSKGRQKIRVEARNLLCYWAVRELGMALIDLARILEMSPSAVSYAVEIVEIIAKDNNYQLTN